MRRRLLLLAGIVCLAWAVAGATCVDKEPGLSVTVQSASVSVEGMAETTVVGADLETRLHVGKHALAGRDAITIQSIDLVAGETAVARVIPDRPPEFEESLEPGETRTFTIAARSREGTFPDARETLCSGSPEVEILMMWTAEVSTGGTSTMQEMGRATATTTDVSCL